MKRIPSAPGFSRFELSLSYTFFSLLTIFLFISLSISPSFAQTLPSGFSQVRVANNISKPTVLAFAPDGRIFVAEQSGALRVIKNGALLATSFVQLSVNASGERGLIGVALDPNFATNKYIYLYYTVSSGTLRNRVSRFTANGDVVLAGSEKIVLELDPLSSATNHNGGAMQFGKDGKLYIAVGDNANRANAQNLDTYHGKVLRINADGSVPAGNPFISGTEQKKRVWAYGLRNPYTFAFQPGTGRLFVNDVGEATWEEINDATTGGMNFGWPNAEGYSSNSAYKNPVHAYQHWSNVESGCAITGGVFFNPATSKYPTTYTGKYFYQDLCNNWINFIDVSGSTAVRTKFASGLPGQSLSLTLGNDGNLYYLSRNDGALYKIIYTNNIAPAITMQPASVTVSEGQSATFSVSVSGTSPFTYQWRKNGVNISGATGANYTLSSTTSSSAGQYNVVVSNSAGSVTSNTATLTVTTYNAAPTAKITSPANHSLYSAGSVISFSGTGTDLEDGTLPASAFSWAVEFHHDTHKHDGPPVASGVKSGSFTIPNQGETAVNVWYRLILTVTDSKGIKHSNYIDLDPKVVTINLASSPTGLQLNLNNLARTTPFALNYVAGMLIPLNAPSPQTLNGTTYQFSNWSTGTVSGANIVVPDANTLYTANFTAAGSQEVSSFTLINADTDQPVAGYDPIATGATLNLATLPTRNLNIRANTNPATVGSVRFSYDGTVNYRTESTAPYCIGGDQGNYDYLPWSPATGSHTLTGTPFSGAGATGTAGTAKTITFSVVNAATANCTASGNILREYWSDVTGESTASIPVSTAPTFTSQLTSFEAPGSVDDNYGQRIRGYICAPASGSYTFYIASDDSGELWLSATDSPADKQKIASVTGWAYPREWDKYASQKSATVRLEAGQKYYIEALHKEAAGGDNLAVGWTTPGSSTIAVIPGSVLSPATAGNTNSPTVSITSPATGGNYNAPATIAITANASDADGSIIKVEFFNGHTKLGEDLTAPYSFNWAVTAAGSYSLTAKATDNLGLTTTSAPVPVTINGTSACTASGTILREHWSEVYGGSVADIPMTTAPASSSQLSLFEAPSGLGRYYGARIRGYICPPQTGYYIFFISSDDNSELWLSTTDNPANKQKIASVSGWTTPRQWDKYASQKSVSVRLEAGKRYYIEALHSQAWGDDNLAVAWQLPGGNMEAPIPGNRLSPYELSKTISCHASGTILREHWSGVSGSSVNDIPLSSRPGSTSQLNSFEAPSGLGSNYGARVRGYICPPQTGNYTFFIASDDNSELWLSTTDSPANKVKIASVTGWTSPRQWDKYATQKSAAIRLEAGKRYYIEALHKQGWGGDNLAVGWQLPNINMEAPIPGSRLSPYVSATVAMQSLSERTGIVPDEGVMVVPNPFTTSVTIVLPQEISEMQYLKIADIAGRVVYENAVQAKEGEIQLSLLQLRNGLYILTIRDEKGKQRSVKLIKQ